MLVNKGISFYCAIVRLFSWGTKVAGKATKNHYQLPFSKTYWVMQVYIMRFSSAMITRQCHNCFSFFDIIIISPPRPSSTLIHPSEISNFLVSFFTFNFFFFFSPLLCHRVVQYEGLKCDTCKTGKFFVFSSCERILYISSSILDLVVSISKWLLHPCFSFQHVSPEKNNNSWTAQKKFRSAQQWRWSGGWERFHPCLMSSEELLIRFSQMLENEKLSNS